MKIEEIIFWILFSLGIFVVIWYIFGKSPTIDQALLIFILTMVVKNSINIKGISSDIKHFKNKFNNLENSFIRLASDFREHIKHK